MPLSASYQAIIFQEHRVDVVERRILGYIDALRTGELPEEFYTAEVRQVLNHGAILVEDGHLRQVVLAKLEAWKGRYQELTGTPWEA